MGTVVGVRLNAEQDKLIDQLVQQTNSTKSMILGCMIDYFVDHPEVTEKLFGDKVLKRSRSDFLTELGGTAFYGGGRNLLYSFGQSEKIVVLSVSRTMSRGESLMITIDGNRVRDAERICKETGRKGFLALRFRSSTDEPWRYLFKPLDSLTTTPFFYRGDTTKNYFLRLRDLQQTDTLSTAEELSQLISKSS